MAKVTNTYLHGTYTSHLEHEKLYDFGASERFFWKKTMLRVVKIAEVNHDSSTFEHSKVILGMINNCLMGSSLSVNSVNMSIPVEQDLQGFFH